MIKIFSKPSGYKNLNTSQMIYILPDPTNNIDKKINLNVDDNPLEKKSYFNIINDNFVCSLS